MYEPQDLIKRADRAFTGEERSNVESLWYELSEFILNNESNGFITKKSSGSRLTRRLYDATAIKANIDFASTIHATLTNPVTKWSRIRFRDENLNNNEDAIRWLQEANNRIHDALNDSNFDSQIGKAYQSYTGLGTMVLLHEQKNNGSIAFDGFKFSALHLSEVAFCENSEGVVDTLYRRFQLTAKQIVEKFPDNVPDVVQNCVENNKLEEKFEIYHCIYPRKSEDVKYDDSGLASPKNRPYASLYIFKKGPVVLEEDGFYELPFYAPRFSLAPGEVYGRGPGHIALPDIRSLNKLRELSLQSLAKAVNPPILVDQRSLVANLTIRPGQMSVVRDINSIKEMTTEARFDVVQVTIQEYQKAIKEYFYLDKLLLPPREEIGEMTAYEVATRVEQVNRVLGPALSRLNYELLQPLIVRCFKMMLRGGAFPPVPEVLRQAGIDVNIAFVNPLARSQQIEDVTNIQQWVQEMAMLAQIKPEVVDFIDADAIATYSANIRNVPEVAVTNVSDVKKTRKQRQEQMQQQMQMEQAVSLADVASKTGGMGGMSGK